VAGAGAVVPEQDEGGGCAAGGRGGVVWAWDEVGVAAAAEVDGGEVAVCGEFAQGEADQGGLGGVVFGEGLLGGQGGAGCPFASGEPGGDLGG
jgi:hypothetical protein